MGVNVALLRDLSLFTNLSKSQLEKVAGICRKITVYPGQILFQHDGKLAVSMMPRLPSACHRKTASMKSEL